MMNACLQVDPTPSKVTPSIARSAGTQISHSFTVAIIMKQMYIYRIVQQKRATKELTMPGLDSAYVLASFIQANLCEEMKTTLEHATPGQAYLLLILVRETGTGPIFWHPSGKPRK